MKCTKTLSKGALTKTASQDIRRRRGSTFSTPQSNQTREYLSVFCNLDREKSGSLPLCDLVEEFEKAGLHSNLIQRFVTLLGLQGEKNLTYEHFSKLSQYSRDLPLRALKRFNFFPFSKESSETNSIH
jgi:Ca2+-binding EF-hand superfamily protein